MPVRKQCCCSPLLQHSDRREGFTIVTRNPWGEPLRPVVEGLKLPLPVNARISCCRYTRQHSDPIIASTLLGLQPIHLAVHDESNSGPVVKDFYVLLPVQANNQVAAESSLRIYLRYCQYPGQTTFILTSAGAQIQPLQTVCSRDPTS